ncbi:MAG: hypothetical protein JWN09_210 [Microbacteriaceae bacterium]|jgi:hypothetical protein|nr:hypothetical protein [Microbacteriaceae bacterium]
MSDAVVVSVAAIRVRAALELQVRGLEDLVRRFDEARDGIPRASDSEIWRGEAQRRYVAAVETLARELATADTLIRSALSHSRRALSTMAERVG